MKGQTHGGKGSTPRPTNKRRFDENYEAIFNKTTSKGESQMDAGVHITETDGRSGESKFREHVEGQGVQGPADQEQAIEPVAWRVYYEVNGHYIIFQQFPYGVKQIDDQRGVQRDIQPLYAHPPKRKPLSDEYIEKVILYWDDVDEEMDLVEFARAIEKAHGIE